MQKSFFESDLCTNVRLLALMNANNCVFSRNEQQKVYFHMSKLLTPPPTPTEANHI